MHKIPVGVLGASGYTGRELVALVHRHPQLSLAFASANSQRGATARLGGRNVTFLATEEAPLSEAALVFSCLPHGASAEWTARARAAGAKVVDLSHDLRPGNDGPVPAVYGLTELARDAVRGADLVANPGCYPTSILVPLAPLVRGGHVARGAVVTANSASGVTGAGMTPRLDLLFAEVSEDFRAYGVGNVHRHLREMRATLRDWGLDADLLFTPHLLPVARGILTTLVVPLAAPLDDPMAPFRAAYADEPCIELADAPPTLREVQHRNVVRLHATMAQGTRTPTLLVLSAIDNLVKGAAGQALQNANLMLGLSETAGLPL